MAIPIAEVLMALPRNLSKVIFFFQIQTGGRVVGGIAFDRRLNYLVKVNIVFTYTIPDLCSCLVLVKKVVEKSKMKRQNIELLTTRGANLLFSTSTGILILTSVIAELSLPKTKLWSDWVEILRN